MARHVLMSSVTSREVRGRLELAPRTPLRVDALSTNQTPAAEWTTWMTAAAKRMLSTSYRSCVPSWAYRSPQTTAWALLVRTCQHVKDVGTKRGITHFPYTSSCVCVLTVGPRVGGDGEAGTSDEGVVGNSSSADLFSSGVSNQDSGRESKTVEGLGPGTQPSDDSSVTVAVLTSPADTSAQSSYSKHGSSLELFASSGEQAQQQGAVPELTSTRKQDGSSLHKGLDDSSTRTAEDKLAHPK